MGTTHAEGTDDARAHIETRFLDAAARAAGVRLALHTIKCDEADLLARGVAPRAEPVVLFHGAVENGRIFYTRAGKGLAPFLARKGYVVSVLDFRGHGESTPRVSRAFDYGIHDLVVEDIPLAISTALAGSRAGTRAHVMAHSYGGTLLLASLARHPQLLARCASVVTFASRRRIRSPHPKKIYMIDVVWNRAAFLLGRAYGYLPAQKFGFGVEPEAKTWHADTVRWIREIRWRDPEDGFDYGAAWKRAGWLGTATRPRMLFLTGGGDPVLGHPRDVRDLQAECPVPDTTFHLVSARNGHLHDYDHIGLLTHRDAPGDHFAWLARWLEGNA